jgi:hypothetical protein
VSSATVREVIDERLLPSNITGKSFRRLHSDSHILRQARLSLPQPYLLDALLLFLSSSLPLTHDILFAQSFMLCSSCPVIQLHSACPPLLGALGFQPSSAVTLFVLLQTRSCLQPAKISTVPAYQQMSPGVRLPLVGTLVTCPSHLSMTLSPITSAQVLQSMPASVLTLP